MGPGHEVVGDDEVVLFLGELSGDEGAGCFGEVLLGGKGTAAGEAIPEDAGVEARGAAAGWIEIEGDELVAVFGGFFEGGGSVQRSAWAEISDVRVAAHLPEHVVGAEAVTAIERVEQADIDPEDAGALGH